jgi:hypothetical protein
MYSQREKTFKSSPFVTVTPRLLLVYLGLQILYMKLIEEYYFLAIFVNDDSIEILENITM